jgi:hypothetical protein
MTDAGKKKSETKLEHFMDETMPGNTDARRESHTHVHQAS